MDRAKLFLENFFVYGLITMLNKVIPLLLLPVMTRLLADPADFGVYDMFNLIIGFGSPLAMLGIYDAMFREYFEEDDQNYSYNVTTTANYINLITAFIVGAVLILFKTPVSIMLFGTRVHGNIVILAAISLIIGNITTIFGAPTRIQNKRKVFVFSGLLSSLSYYIGAIVLIYLGYSYFGMIYASIASTVFLFLFFWVLNKDFFTQGKFDKQIAKELLKVGIPLVPIFIIYWVYNSMDKIMIANMIGATELGIYSIGSRFASVSTFIYAAFSGGWQYFAFSTMKDEDQVSLNSKVFEYLGVVSFLSLIVIYPFVPSLFTLLFPSAYAEGVRIIPYLYLSPLLLMLFQVVGNQFLVIKKSYWSTIALSTGAILNVLLNWLLITPLGIEGAAIATLVGYVFSVVIVSLLAFRLKLHVISKRFLRVSAVLISYFIMSRMFLYENVVGQVFLSLLCTLIYLYWYKEELFLIYSKVKLQLVKIK